jgi:hypothetical protein
MLAARLRRTFASLRCAVGDDVAYTAARLGHEDAVFSLKSYTHAVMRRDRLTGHELEQFERAIEWAQWARMGTNDEIRDLAAVEESVPRRRKPRASRLSDHQRAICPGVVDADNRGAISACSSRNAPRGVVTIRRVYH